MAILTNLTRDGRFVYDPDLFKLVDFPKYRFVIYYASYCEFYHIIHAIRELIRNKAHLHASGKLPRPFRFVEMYTPTCLLQCMSLQDEIFYNLVQVA